MFGFMVVISNGNRGSYDALTGALKSISITRVTGTGLPGSGSFTLTSTGLLPRFLRFSVDTSTLSASTSSVYFKISAHYSASDLALCYVIFKQGQIGYVELDCIDFPVDCLNYLVSYTIVNSVSVPWSCGYVSEVA